jgi:hypothetical protein
VKVKAKYVRAAREALAESIYRRNPRRGRAAALAEATALLDRKLGPEGRRIVREAEAKASRKASRKAVSEAAIRRRVDEALTAALAPAPQPGTGAAPSAAGDGDSLFGAMARQSRRGSPFWQGPAATAAPKTGAPAADTAGLAAMDADEFRATAQAAFGDYAQARGFASPSWQ